MEETFIQGRRKCVNRFFPLIFFYHLLLHASRTGEHLVACLSRGKYKKVETLSKECYMREQINIRFGE
jgi:hypothetical protein